MVENRPGGNGANRDRIRRALEARRPYHADAVADIGPHGLDRDFGVDDRDP